MARYAPLLIILTACALAACRDEVTPVAPTPELRAPLSLGALGGSGVALTDDPVIQSGPDIDGDIVVWSDLRDGEFQIYSLDLSTGIERRLSSNDRAAFHAAISGSRVVWQSVRDDGHAGIYLYDTATGEERRLSASTNVQAPAISGDHVVWVDMTAGFKIHLYDLATGTERAISTGSANIPDIEGSLVVWQEGNPATNTPNIRAYDLRTGSRYWVSESAMHQLAPVTDGSNVAWTGTDGGPSDVYLYEAASHSARRLTTSPGSDYSPAIGAGRVAWVTDREGGADLFVFDLASGLERQVSHDDAYEGFPAIGGDRIVAQRWVPDVYDIWLYSIFGAPDPGETLPGSDVVVVPTDQATGLPAPATISFGSVTEGGTTTVTSSEIGGSSGPPAPANFRLGSPPTYYDIKTTAAFSGTATVCIDYSGASFGGAESLKLLHYENGLWGDITTSLDQQTQTICGATTSFSPFLVAEPNAAPFVNRIQLPEAPVPLGSAVHISAAYSDANTGDTHSVTVAWEDGSAAATASGGVVSASHVYAAPGVYTVSVSVSDGELSGTRSSSQDLPSYIVVFDPSAGFVTGGGWIASGAGSCRLTEACQIAAGRATFGFVSRYRPGASLPSGSTEFQFDAGGLSFSSSSYDWMVPAGARAQFKGSGRINGGGSYGFLITAIDGALQGSGGMDRFRIKIWEKATGRVVYDNQMGSGEDSDASTALGGGSIVIHR